LCIVGEVACALVLWHGFLDDGYEVYILKGGYKTYRRFVLDIFEKKYQLAVLGGKTGSGKTVILNELKSNGEQVVDLEKLAHHKGSAFGAIHELPQPTQEQFENDLALTLNDLDEKKMMWVEDESRGVGRCFIPKSFWIQLRLAPLFMIETNNEQRITQLVKDYSTFSVEQLEAPIRNIEKRLGNEQMNIALQALQERDFENVANMMLRYYDKAYNKCMTKKETNYIATIDYKQGSYESIANDLPLQYQLFLKKKTMTMNSEQPIRLTQYSHGAGCGCKLSPAVLDTILKGDVSPQFKNLLVGNSSRDDAAVYDLGDGSAVISTTDFFMPIVDDAFDFGAIASANAVSDVYAMVVNRLWRLLF
jgi:hypothetical protein